jgi:dinuclear metal center YbgI/SA1388 family protein
LLPLPRPSPWAGRGTLPFKQRFASPNPLAELDHILAYLDQLLSPGDFEDYGPNGLQVPGAEQVSTVATGVSAHRELFERAREAGAELVLVHHGLLWDGGPRHITRTMAARLRVLLEADMSLAAYHLPLDAHPEVGNNALIARRLGCQQASPFSLLHGRPIGVAGRFGGDGLAAGELFERVRELTGREPLVFDSGPQRVSSIGVVSGAAAGALTDAVEAGLDAFLTGEPAERVMGEAREAGVHFIAAGHYATETFGVRRLGELLAERFDLHHVFVDVPNPV